VEWRITYKKRTGKTAGRNTALLELKTLAMIIGEAVRLGHADANPLVSIKLRRDKAAKKPELTDEEIVEIREAFKSEPEWMQRAFEIAEDDVSLLQDGRDLFKKIGAIVGRQARFVGKTRSQHDVADGHEGDGKFGDWLRGECGGIRAGLGDGLQGQPARKRR